MAVRTDDAHDSNDVDEAIKRRVREQFSGSADDYVRSRGHAMGPDLRRMVEHVQPKRSERLLDIATGGGHVARIFGPLVGEVFIADLTRAMLLAAGKALGAAGIDRVAAVVADAERLPFATASFQIVTCRIAPHHFPQPQRFVEEVARILAPGGRFALVDSTVPEGEVGAIYNRYELIRDPSHVRSLTVAEWQGLIEATGLRIDVVETFRKSHDFDDWTGRSQSDPASRAALMDLMRGAGPEVQAHYATVWESDMLVSFTDDKTLFVASR